MTSSGSSIYNANVKVKIIKYPNYVNFYKIIIDNDISVVITDEKLEILRQKGILKKIE
jgi:hypothetical protein